VKHYAGDVEYEITSFNEKNKDTVSEVINQTLFTSKSSLLSLLFAKPP
jgi:myosin heavy subunit